MHLKKTADGKQAWALSPSDKLRTGVTGTSSDGVHTTFRTRYGSIRTRRISGDDARIWARMPLVAGITLLLTSFVSFPISRTTFIAFCIAMVLMFALMTSQAIDNEDSLPWPEALLMSMTGFMLDERLAGHAWANQFLHGPMVYVTGIVTASILLLYVSRWIRHAVWEPFVSGCVFVVLFWSVGLNPQGYLWITPLLMCGGLFSLLLALRIWSASIRYEQGISNVREY